MTDSIKEKVRALILDTFQLDSRNHSLPLDADSIRDWDSLGHLRLVLRLEKEFALKIDPADIPSLLNEEAITDTVLRLSSRC